MRLIAHVAAFQESVDPSDPLAALPDLVALVRNEAPPQLADSVQALDREACQAAMEDYLLGGDTSSPRSFFARILLQPAQFGCSVRGRETSGSCPCCGHAPQAGLLKELAHGQALWLSCSLCFHQWEYPRRRCVACAQPDAKSLAFYKAEEMPHIQVMTCDECRQYLHLIDLAKEPQAVPDIDELSALPLDVWAVEKGYCKLQPNLAGI